MEAIWRNVIYSVRMLLKRPGFTTVAVVAIALGIGANTAIFSVVNTVLLRPLPFDRPEQLLILSTGARNQPGDGGGTFSVPDFLDIQARASTLEYVATYNRSGTILTEGGEPERLIGAAVTADYFPLFRTKPILGRVFTRDEDKPGAAPVIVLSHDPLGKRILIDGDGQPPREIIGVVNDVRRNGLDVGCTARDVCFIFAESRKTFECDAEG